MVEQFGTECWGRAIAVKGEKMKYIHKHIIKNIPSKWKFDDGKTTGNFHEMSVVIHIAEGWLPVTVVNGEDYDPEIQTRTDPIITENTDHAVLDYTVISKPLNDVKKAKKSKVKSEGVAILLTKWDLHKRQLEFSTPQEDSDMDADQATLVSYYTSTINGLINNANSVQEVRDIIYTWPTI